MIVDRNPRDPGGKSPRSRRLPREEYDFGSDPARTMIMGICGRHTVETAHDHETPLGWGKRLAR